ncbi:hypothetical protein B0H63DRAFT_465330 [Podospora didyma]|uniref:Uncharacterized protein n=1 Tax=Podospora didyma TaxID=330526 RepID=A0AAE0U4N5_9PEZI|nr:hypothetical protein B0H63DRAFT_465330 [Podospora didyma]
MAANDTNSSQVGQRRQTVVSPPAAQAPAGGDPAFWGWLNEYLNAILGIAVLGGQITFTVIVSDIADPSTLGLNDPSSFPTSSPIFSKEKVRFLIALSWLFFTSTLGLGVLTKVLVASGPLSTSSGPVSASGRRAFTAVYGTLTLLLNALPIGAFLLLALAVVAYSPVVGWIAVGLIGIFGLFVLFLWFILDSGI